MFYCVLNIPEPEPDAVELELLPGEGVASCGDRARTAESAETTDRWGWK